jgi:hypothetical protein
MTSSDWVFPRKRPFVKLGFGVRSTVLVGVLAGALVGVLARVLAGVLPADLADLVAMQQLSNGDGRLANRLCDVSNDAAATQRRYRGKVKATGHRA